MISKNTKHAYVFSVSMCIIICLCLSACLYLSLLLADKPADTTIESLTQFILYTINTTLGAACWLPRLGSDRASLHLCCAARAGDAVVEGGGVRAVPDTCLLPFLTIVRQCLAR